MYLASYEEFYTIYMLHTFTEIGFINYKTAKNLAIYTLIRLLTLSELFMESMRPFRDRSECCGLDWSGSG
jgi:hypothetical protein